MIAANPTARTFDVPESARVLFDELTLWGDTEHARTSLEKWYSAGAEMPALTLPPGRPVEELDHISSRWLRSIHEQPRGLGNITASGAGDVDEVGAVAPTNHACGDGWHPS